MFEEILGGLGNFGGGIANLFGAGGKGGEESYKKAVELLMAVQSPDFDMSQISPEDLNLIGEYFPEQYQAIIQGQPEKIAGSPEMRAHQLSALDQLGQMQKTGFGDAERMAMEDIARGISREGQRGTESAMEQMAAQGRLGGGQEAALRASSGQNAMELGRGLGNDLMQQAIQNRMRAIGMGADLSGTVRGQDVREQTVNADTMNRFNEWVSQLGTQAARDNTMMRQEARNKTLSERQRIADQNAMNRQGTYTENLNRKNQLLGQDFSNRLSLAQAQANALQGRGQQQDQSKYARESNIMNLGRGFGQMAGGGLDIWAGGGGLGEGMQDMWYANQYRRR